MRKTNLSKALAAVSAATALISGTTAFAQSPKWESETFHFDQRPYKLIYELEFPRGTEVTYELEFRAYSPNGGAKDSGHVGESPVTGGSGGANGSHGGNVSGGGIVPHLTIDDFYAFSVSVFDVERQAIVSTVRHMQPRSIHPGPGLLPNQLFVDHPVGMAGVGRVDLSFSAPNGQNVQVQAKSPFTTPIVDITPVGKHHARVSFNFSATNSSKPRVEHVTSHSPLPLPAVSGPVAAVSMRYEGIIDRQIAAVVPVRLVP